MSDRLRYVPHVPHNSVQQWMFIVALFTTALGTSETTAQATNSDSTGDSNLLTTSTPGQANVTTTGPASLLFAPSPTVSYWCNSTHSTTYDTSCTACKESIADCHDGDISVTQINCTGGTDSGMVPIENCRWRCLHVDINPQCCYGYSGEACSQEVNPCNSSTPPCDSNSQCIHTGPGRHTCSCNEGYTGNGNKCDLINPCRYNNGGCNVTTTNCMLLGPNKHECTCKDGYEGYIQGQGCTLKDMCTGEPCGPNGVCQTKVPKKYSCICNKGYTLFRDKCYGSIIQTLTDMNTKDPKLMNKLQYMVNITARLYHEFLSQYRPLTILVPTDEAFRNLMSSTDLDRILSDDDKIKWILRQHILVGEFVGSSIQCFNLQGNEARMKTFSNVTLFVLGFDNSSLDGQSEVIPPFHQATNGIVYVINKVMGLNDVIVEYRQKTALDLIIAQPEYTTLLSIITATGLSKMFSQPNTTVLLPSNTAWMSLPYEYLLIDEAGLKKLEVILKNHVFPGVIDVTQFIKAQNMTSYANVNVKVKVSSEGQIQFDGKSQITKASIPVRTGLCHRVDQVIVPDSESPLMKNTCDSTKTEKVEGYCVPCKFYFLLRCKEQTDTPVQTVDCGYTHFYPFGYTRYRNYNYDYFPPPAMPFLGREDLRKCLKICTRETKISACCSGFYGDHCTACPGGSAKPCHGNGRCSEGKAGKGECKCNTNFTGIACNQCSQKNNFGVRCDKQCTCQYGQCDAGPKGTGRCKPATCQLGYTGDNCDKKLGPCENDLCEVNSSCFHGENGTESCYCTPGYEKKEEKCVQVDFCAGKANICHNQATCSEKGPGVIICTCRDGWHGDGFQCMPNHLCDSPNQCHNKAFCQDLQSGKFLCVCMPGYEGNGRTCKLVNPCVENNGGCHAQAQCTFIEKRKRNCTCPQYMVGDGITCSGTIAAEVMVHPQLTKVRDLMKIVNSSNNILDNVTEVLTFFAPSDSAMELFLRQQNNPKYWSQEENVLTFLNFHTLYGDYTIDDFMTSHDTVTKYPTLYDGFLLHIVSTNMSVRIFANNSKLADFIDVNNFAFNGVFHIVDLVLETFLPDGQEPSLEDALSSQPQYRLFYDALQKTKLLEEITLLDEYTVFVLSNDVVKMMDRKLTKDFLKYYIVHQREFTPSMSDGDRMEPLLGTRHQLLIHVLNNQITVNDIQIVRPDILTDVGVIHELNGVLHPILNRCDVNKSYVSLGPCGDCGADNLSCSEGLITHDTTYSCNFQKQPDAKFTIGCQKICINITSNSECCGGYYGPHCEECPGGAENPCTGNGVCDDGESGSGKCKCNPGLSGTLCDKCASADLVPPYCNISYHSCEYMNGNCSYNALCNETSSGITCHCLPGYKGDGFTCTSLCLIKNGGCHDQANCDFVIQERIVECKCKLGHHGNGTWCEKNRDLCQSDNGGCDLERANCTFIEPEYTDMTEGSTFCECQPGYVGDGKLCSSNLLDAMARLPELSSYHSWLHRADKNSVNKIHELFGDESKILTVFTPVRKFTNINNFVVVDGKINLNMSTTDSSKQWHMKSINRQAITVILNDQGQYLVNSVKIIRANIEAHNGVLHLIEKPLPSFDEMSAGKLTSIVSHSTTVIICVGVAVTVILAVIIAFIIYKTRKHVHNSINSSISLNSYVAFSKLKAEDNEDISHNVQYENPLYSSQILQ